MARAIFIVLGILFLVIAAIQFNDPDPVYWVLVYLATAAILFGRAFGTSSRIWTAMVIGAVVAGMTISLPGLLEFLRAGNYAAIASEMMVDNPVEEAREFIGLAIAAAVLLISLRGSPDR